MIQNGRTKTLKSSHIKPVFDPEHQHVENLDGYNKDWSLLFVGEDCESDDDGINEQR